MTRKAKGDPRDVHLNGKIDRTRDRLSTLAAQTGDSVGPQEFEDVLVALNGGRLELARRLRRRGLWCLLAVVFAAAVGAGGAWIHLACR